MTREEQKKLFEEMPVRSAVLRQAFPAVASQMVVLLYNLADTYFVGLLNDPVQTAAVTVSVAPFLMLTAISNLFGVGGSSAMSRALGAKDTMLARRISSTAFWWSLMTSLIYTVIFLVFSRQILTCCGATEATMSATWSYTRWVVLAGGPATVLNMFFANMCRA